VTQSKVLRALENRTVERLGGTQSIPVDVRVISATQSEFAAGDPRRKISRDLFYRLRVVTIELPPLRAHKEDIAIPCGGVCAAAWSAAGANGAARQGSA